MKNAYQVQKQIDMEICAELPELWHNDLDAISE